MTMNLDQIDGRPFTLLLMSTTPEGDDDWAVLPGLARREGGSLFIDRGPRPRFEVRPEWIDRVKPVDPELRPILRGADFYLALTAGHLDDDPADFVPTGLKWPD
jgi:hypothetical protein